MFGGFLSKGWILRMVNGSIDGSGRYIDIYQIDGSKLVYYSSTGNNFLNTLTFYFLYDLMTPVNFIVCIGGTIKPNA